MLRIDLGGGLYSVSRSLHLAGWAPGRIVIADGTLLASPDFPPGEFLINLTDVSGISFEDLTFDSAHRGGGLRLDCTKQISVSSVYFSCTMRPPACSATRTRRHTTPRAIGAWVTSCCWIVAGLQRRITRCLGRTAQVPRSICGLATPTSATPSFSTRSSAYVTAAAGMSTRRCTFGPARTLQ